MGYRQWIRDISLVVGKGGGEGIELKGLKTYFDVLKTDTETPNKASVKIWNLNDDTAQKIKEEFDTVIIKAGYENNIGLIYDGGIIQVRYLRENSVDKVTHILMGDGDEGYQFAIVKKTLSAGSTQKDIYDAAMEEFKKFDITEGALPDNLEEFQLPRAKTMFRNARDIMRDICVTTGCSWSIQDGKLNIIKLEKTLPDEAVVLSFDTGMVNPGPEQTTQGIKVRCLLNHEIKVGGRVKIEGEIAEAERGGKKDKPPAALASDGIYRVVECRYFGDSYNGRDWYCDIVGVAMDASGNTTTDRGY